MANAASAKIRWLQRMGMNNQARDKKIELINSMIQKALLFKSYKSKPYLEVLEEHRLLEKDISLGSYLKCEAGVCRENALLTHLALKAVGVPNKYVYVKVQTLARSKDHAMVVIEDVNAKWIIDPTTRHFMGENFKR